MALKFTSPGLRGVPDRIALMPGGKVVFVELKRPGEKLSEAQKELHEKFRALGCDIRVIDSIDDAWAFALGQAV